MRVVPYLLIALLFVGVGLGAALGVSEGPVTQALVAGPQWQPCTTFDPLNDGTPVVNCIRSGSHLTIGLPSSIAIPHGFAACMTLALDRVMSKYPLSGEFGQEVKTAMSMCGDFRGSWSGFSRLS